MPTEQSFRCLLQVFMEVGAKELVFIERSGLLFGFIFGCLQTCLWYFYQEDWVLPVGGLVVRNHGDMSQIPGTFYAPRFAYIQRFFS